jgi:hypothetical protein
MPVERRDGYWLWTGGPVTPGASGITFGPLVITRSLAPSPHLLRHETVHVEQWRRLGAVGFLRQYLAAYALGRLAGYPHWAAYRRIPLEIEAEWRARGGSRSPRAGVT